KGGFILTPGRYVGAEEEEDDPEEFEEKMKRLTSDLAKQMQEGANLDSEIKKNLIDIGFKI
ncbi:MAG: SAM-dependent DNA methyltransferase, partial [Thaumarchaeota archaeon]|nr:SAM-dependent DNA methyltransferase [Nitrososphaerota archaeon]